MEMTATEMFDIVSSFGINEYGVGAAPIVKLINENRSPNGLVTALNNSDTDGVFLELIDRDPERVIFGMKALGTILGTENCVLHVPDWADEIAKKVAPHCAQNGIELKKSLVNKRDYPGWFLSHIVTAAEIADALCGKYEDGIYISVNGEKLKKYPKNTKLCSLLDMSDIKGIIAGYRIHGKEDAALTVEEADIANGVLKQIRCSDCVINEVSTALLKSRKQSCGKCVFCREGLIQLDEMHSDITHKKGKSEYVDLSVEIGNAMTFSTPCSMGQKSPEIVLSALEAFKDEYDAHIKKKICSSGKCISFVNIYVDPLSCNGCGKCAQICPVDCIDGIPGYIHLIGDFECTKCSKCIDACPIGAVIKTTSRVPKLPDRFIKCGKFNKH